MELKEVMEKRRSYRSFDKVDITDEMVSELAHAASLMPSCYNNQPWRYVFIRNRDQLTRITNEGLSKGNSWAKKSSMFIAVVTAPEFDCEIKGNEGFYDRNYFLFDTGMATGGLLLKGTELGLVIHPIAGYFPDRIHDICRIPIELQVITLLCVGKKSGLIPDDFADFQKEAERTRPIRKNQAEFCYFDQM